MTSSFKKFFLPILVCGLLSLASLVHAQTVLESTTADGAKIGLSPETGNFGVGKTFTLNVVVDSTRAFNSANATLNFSKDILSVQSLSKTSSALSLWAVEPTFSNGAGTVTFEGGNTAPLTGKKTLLSITFKALKEGDATISFGNASVLAADGRGTDILSVKTSSTYEISATGGGDAAPPPPPPPPAAPVATGPPPDAPEISSPTHPEEDRYYNAEKAKFVWEAPFDVTAVRLAFDEKEKTIPTTGYDPPISEKEYDNLKDGVMYFHLRYRNDAGWGPAAHRKIMIDRTPPSDLKFTAAADASSTDVLLTMSATDTLSRLDRYEFAVDGGNPAKIALGELKDGTYTLTGQTPGEHTITLVAYDKAGNSASVEAKFTIAGDPLAGTKKAVVDEEEKPIDWRLIGEIALIALIAFLVGYLWYERSAFRHEKYLVKREADELRDNMGNIFAAVREEVGEQVGRLFQKPNPSAEDRKVMENINEAIDLSEELLSKELEDVRKLLL